jgi:Myb-like DNA-binding domain
MQRLARQERLKTLIAVPPSQILDAHDLRWRTLGSNTNARVLDPVQALADEARRRPWSAEERRTFLEKFSQYGKQFSRIAAHLPLRSTADCVVWYYRHQKTDAGFTGKRKTQLKRRRQYAELKRTYGSGGGGVAYERGGGAAAAAYPGDGAAPVAAAGPPRSRAGATAEARQEKAALAAAAKAAGKPVGLAARRLERQAAALAEAEALFNEADTEALVAAVRVHGKSFKAIATATGFSAAQVKMFWTAHRLSKDLDTLATQAQAAAVAAAERAQVQQVVPVADPAAAAMASAALLSAFPGGLPPLLPHPALLAMASGATGGQQGDQQQAGGGDSNAMMRAMMMQQAGIALAAQAFGGAFSGLGAGENANAGGDGMQPSAEPSNRTAPHPVLRCVAFIQTHTKDDDDGGGGAAEEGGMHEEAQDGAANVAVAEQREGEQPHGGAGGGGEAQDAAQDMVIDEEAPDGGEALKSGGDAQD